MGYSQGGIKRDKYDALFSELVRERADYRCEVCGKNYRHEPGKLTCMHIYGRRKQGVRLDPMNALAGCFGCHRYLEENPVEMARLAEQLLGLGNYELLQYKAHKITRMRKADKEWIHKHYLAERKRINKLRSEGVRGRIEFTLPDQEAL